MNEQLPQERSEYSFTFQNQQGCGRIARRGSQGRSVSTLTLRKSINEYFCDKELRVDVSVDQKDQVVSLVCRGYLWQNLMMTLLVISRRYTIYRQDVLDSLACYSSVEDLVEIYEGERDRLLPRL